MLGSTFEAGDAQMSCNVSQAGISCILQIPPLGALYYRDHITSLTGTW